MLYMTSDVNPNLFNLFKAHSICAFQKAAAPNGFDNNTNKVAFCDPQIHPPFFFKQVDTVLSIPQEAGSVAVLFPRCEPLSPGSIPGTGIACPFGFQSKLASAGFPPGTLVFLLHLKLHFFSLFLSIRSEGSSGKQCLYTE